MCIHNLWCVLNPYWYQHAICVFESLDVQACKVFGQATIISWFFFIHPMKTISFSKRKMSFLDFCTTIRPKMMSLLAKVPVRSATIKMRVGRSCGGLKYSLTISLLIIDVVPMEIILKIFKHILIVRIWVSFDVIQCVI